MVKPMKTLELHYPVIQFLIILDSTRKGNFSLENTVFFLEIDLYK